MYSYILPHAYVPPSMGTKLLGPFISKRCRDSSIPYRD